MMFNMYSSNHEQQRLMLESQFMKLVGNKSIAPLLDSTMANERLTCIQYTEQAEQNKTANNTLPTKAAKLPTFIKKNYYQFLLML